MGSVAATDSWVYGVSLMLAPVLGLGVIGWFMHRLKGKCCARDRVLLHRVKKAPHLVEAVQLTDSGRVLLSVQFSGEKPQVFEHFDSFAAKQLYAAIQSWAPSARFTTQPPDLLEQLDYRG